MKVGRMDHTFVICAHRESPYLEQCIVSLKKQTIKSHIIMVTSTDNQLIREMSRRYHIPLYFNTGKSGIVEDWNFGYDKAHTCLVTIAHQDDIYTSCYTQEMLSRVKKAKRPLIYFSDYGELRTDRRIHNNRLLKVKRLMLIPMEWRIFDGSPFVRRRILSLGNPICCPSVTFVKPNLPKHVFKTGYTCCQDWQAWERISKLNGQFLYQKKVLMYHRIHEDSTTSEMIKATGRSQEDYEMYRKFWPKPVARVLTRLYSTSEKSNDL